MKPATTIRRRRGRGGYTLLEIGIVLFIVAVLTAAMLPSFGGWLSERRLRAPVSDLVRLAREARATASREGTPCTVVISPDSIRIEVDGAPGPGETRAIPGDVSVATKTWREDAFVSRPALFWHFHSSGLCDPLEVRFSRGESWIELAFDPLTASPSSERYAFR
ncbi:MAG TPA: hypothetical protein VIM58_06910 [Candidatus Methylacidiphilales bacterium]